MYRVSMVKVDNQSTSHVFSGSHSDTVKARAWVTWTDFVRNIFQMTELD